MIDPAHQSLTLVAQLERRDVAPILAVRHLRDSDRPSLADTMLAAYHGGFDAPKPSWLT